MRKCLCGNDLDEIETQTDVDQFEPTGEFPDLCPECDERLSRSAEEDDGLYCSDEFGRKVNHLTNSSRAYGIRYALFEIASAVIDSFGSGKSFEDVFAEVDKRLTQEAARLERMEDRPQGSECLP